MKRLVIVAAGLLVIAGVYLTAVASQRLVLFEYFTNVG
jgi:hypothetical protein